MAVVYSTPKELTSWAWVEAAAMAFPKMLALSRKERMNSWLRKDTVATPKKTETLYCYPPRKRI